MPYAELQTTTNFSFLRGASHPEEMVEQAAALGYKAIAITDRNTFAGIVRAHIAAKATGIRFIPACRLDLADGPGLLAFPTNREAYARISNLLTVGNLRTEKGKCLLYKKDVYQYRAGSRFIVLPPDGLHANTYLDPSFRKAIEEYGHVFGVDLYIALVRRYNGEDAKYLFRLAELSKAINVPLVATNDVHYHHPERRELQDVVTCVREKCTIHTAGYKLHPNAERYLKPVEEMKDGVPQRDVAGVAAEDVPTRRHRHPHQGVHHQLDHVVVRADDGSPQREQCQDEQEHGGDDPSGPARRLPVPGQGDPLRIDVAGDGAIFDHAATAFPKRPCGRTSRMRNRAA
jgi:DNA polymerase III alpha subunit